MSLLPQGMQAFAMQSMQNYKILLKVMPEKRLEIISSSPMHQI
jgi:hypothetical protein